MLQQLALILHLTPRAIRICPTLQATPVSTPVRIFNYARVCIRAHIRIHSIRAHIRIHSIRIHISKHP